jgi:uncharacterized protein (TIGR02996 family)
MTREEFIDQVRENPDDDALREVFADFLLERGDPRGEFIQIQLAKHRGTATPRMLRRERELVTKNKKAFLDGLDDEHQVTRKELLVFERGFLAACAVGALAFERAAQHPAWATARDVVFMGPADPSTSWSLVDWLAAAPGARGIHNVPLSVAVDFAKHAPPRLHTLAISGANSGDIPLAHLSAPGGAQSGIAPFDGPGLGELRRFGLRRVFYLDRAGSMREIGPWTEWLHTMPFLPRLERIDVYPVVTLGAAHAWAHDRAPGLRCVAIHDWHTAYFDQPYGWSLVLSRDAEHGDLTRLDATWCASRHPNIHDLLRALESLAPDALTSIHLSRSMPPRGNLTEGQIDLRSERPPLAEARDRTARNALAMALQAQKRLREIVFAGKRVDVWQIIA